MSDFISIQYVYKNENRSVLINLPAFGVAREKIGLDKEPYVAFAPANAPSGVEVAPTREWSAPISMAELLDCVACPRDVAIVDIRDPKVFDLCGVRGPRK